MTFGAKMQSSQLKGPIVNAEPKIELIAPPTPTPDDIDFLSKSRISSKLRFRILIERAVVRAVAHDLLAAGFTLRVHDGEDWACKRTDRIESIMAAVMETDDDRLYVYAQADTANPGPWKEIGSVHFVYGNSGWDVASSSTMNLEPYLTRSSEYAEALSAWC